MISHLKDFEQNHVKHMATLRDQTSPTSREENRATKFCFFVPLFQKQQLLQLLIIFHQKEEPVPIAASARESISNPRLDLAEAQLMQCKGAC